jgi:hypothetical protein
MKEGSIKARSWRKDGFDRLMLVLDGSPGAAPSRTVMSARRAALPGAHRGVEAGCKLCKVHKHCGYLSQMNEFKGPHYLLHEYIT